MKLNSKGEEKYEIWFDDGDRDNMAAPEVRDFHPSSRTRGNAPVPEFFNSYVLSLLLDNYGQKRILGCNEAASSKA